MRPVVRVVDSVAIGDMSKLTPKQAAFVREYLIDLNATQAAIRAGYSAKTAYRTGADNLTKPQIADAIQQGVNKRAQRTEITADRVVQELARIAFGDPRRLFDANGNVKPVTELDDDAAAMLGGLEVVTKLPPGEDCEPEYIHKFKMWDKGAALDKLMKHLGAYAPEKREWSGEGGGPIQITVKPPKNESSCPPSP